MKEILSLLEDSVSVVAETDVIFLNQTLCDLLVRDCVQLFFHLVWIKNLDGRVVNILCVLFWIKLHKCFGSNVQSRDL